MTNREWLNKTEALQHMYVSIATGGKIADSAYTQFVNEFKRNESIKDIMPIFIGICTTPTSFYKFAQSKADTYEERRHI